MFEQWVEQHGLARSVIAILTVTTLGCFAYTWGYYEGVHNGQFQLDHFKEAAKFVTSGGGVTEPVQHSRHSKEAAAAESTGHAASGQGHARQEDPVTALFNHGHHADKPRPQRNTQDHRDKRAKEVKEEEPLPLPAAGRHGQRNDRTLLLAPHEAHVHADGEGGGDTGQQQQQQSQSQGTRSSADPSSWLAVRVALANSRSGWSVARWNRLLRGVPG